jgi:hypothetical protein
MSSYAPLFKAPEEDLIGNTLLCKAAHAQDQDSDEVALYAAWKTDHLLFAGVYSADGISLYCSTTVSPHTKVLDIGFWIYAEEDGYIDITSSLDAFTTRVPVVPGMYWIWTGAYRLTTPANDVLEAVYVGTTASSGSVDLEFLKSSDTFQVWAIIAREVPYLDAIA